MFSYTTQKNLCSLVFPFKLMLHNWCLFWGGAYWFDFSNGVCCSV